MTATIAIILNKADNALLVPVTALSVAQAQIQQGKVRTPVASAAPEVSGAPIPRGGAGGQGTQGGQGARGTATTGFGGGRGGAAGASGTPGTGAAGTGRAQMQYVLVLGADGKPEARQVTIGLTNGTNTQILSGLSDNDQVITQVISANSTTTTGSRTGTGGGIVPGGAGGAGGAGGGGRTGP